MSDTMEYEETIESKQDGEHKPQSNNDWLEVTAATLGTLCRGTFQGGQNGEDVEVERSDRSSNQVDKSEMQVEASEKTQNSSLQEQKGALSILECERDASVSERAEWKALLESLKEENMNRELAHASECAEWRQSLESLKKENEILELALAESEKSSRKEDVRKLQRECDAHAFDCTEWKRDAEHYRNRCELISRETWKVKRERDRLMTENAELRDSWFSARKGNQARTRNQQAEINSLKEELERIKITEQSSRKQAERAEKVAAEASTTSSNLFQMLQMGVVNRTSMGRTVEFLNGDEIQARVRSFQEDSDDFLRDLADLARDQFSLGADAHEHILDNVLVPAAKCAFLRASGFVEDKMANLLALIGDETLLKSNKLVHLLWKSSMQARTTEMVASGIAVDLTEQDLANQDEETKSALLWATLPETRNDDTMEGRHTGSFIRDLFHLELWCRFSDPPCFLHPPVGEFVTYNPSYHVVKHLPNRNKRVAPGRKVRVIAPGLYFAPPTTKERNKPILPMVKATVVMF